MEQHLAAKRYDGFRQGLMLVPAIRDIIESKNLSGEDLASLFAAIPEGQITGKWPLFL